MSSPSDTHVPVVGRNEPCPCRSGKKYKRCHGVSAEPKLTTPKLDPAAMGSMGAMAGGGGPFGMDPSQMDPQMMMKVAQAFQRLPKSQVQKLQSIMQRAMAGKDVTREAQELEHMLPPDFKELLKGFQMPEMPQLTPEEMEQGAQALSQLDMTSFDPAQLGAFGGASGDDMSVNDAKAIVETALKEGKISPEQAQALLGASAEDQATAVASHPTATEGLTQKPESEQSNKFSKLWRSFKGK